MGDNLSREEMQWMELLERFSNAFFRFREGLEHIKHSHQSVSWYATAEALEIDLGVAQSHLIELKHQHGRRPLHGVLDDIKSTLNLLSSVAKRFPQVVVQARHFHRADATLAGRAINDLAEMYLAVMQLAWSDPFFEELKDDRALLARLPSTHDPLKEMSLENAMAKMRKTRHGRFSPYGDAHVPFRVMQVAEMARAMREEIESLERQIGKGTLRRQIHELVEQNERTEPVTTTGFYLTLPSRCRRSLLDLVIKYADLPSIKRAAQKTLPPSASLDEWYALDEDKTRWDRSLNDIHDSVLKCDSSVFLRWVAKVEEEAQEELLDWWKEGEIEPEDAQYASDQLAQYVTKVNQTLETYRIHRRISKGRVEVSADQLLNIDNAVLVELEKSDWGASIATMLLEAMDALGKENTRAAMALARPALEETLKRVTGKPLSEPTRITNFAQQLKEIRGVPSEVADAFQLLTIWCSNGGSHPREPEDLPSMPDAILGISLILVVVRYITSADQGE